MLKNAKNENAYQVTMYMIRMMLTEGDKDAITELMKNRQARRFETQPLEYPSAGSVFRNPEGGWQIAYGNSYHQLETADGKIAVLTHDKEEGNGNIQLLKAIVQQYNNRLIKNEIH